MHARLKNEFTEDEKCHNLMRWLKCVFHLVASSTLAKWILHFLFDFLKLIRIVPGGKLSWTSLKPYTTGSFRFELCPHIFLQVHSAQGNYLLNEPLV